jgi:hypothetical protein
LRESPLIFGCIGHRDAGAVNDFDATATPKLIAADASLELVGGVPMDVL